MGSGAGVGKDYSNGWKACGGGVRIKHGREPLVAFEQGMVWGKKNGYFRKMCLAVVGKIAIKTSF